MGQQRAVAEEAMFWTLEQRAVRHGLDRRRASNLLPWFFSWGYEAISMYGLNVSRPIILWLATLMLFAGIAFPALKLEPAAPHLGAFEKPDLYAASALDALPFSVQQTTVPFYVWTGRGRAEAVDFLKRLRREHDNPLALQLLATLETLLSIVFLALFILALRRRFRMI